MRVSVKVSELQISGSKSVRAPNIWEFETDPLSNLGGGTGPLRHIFGGRGMHRVYRVPPNVTRGSLQRLNGNYAAHHASGFIPSTDPLLFSGHLIPSFLSHPLCPGLGTSLFSFSYNDKKPGKVSSPPSPYWVWSRLDFHHSRDFAIIVDHKTEVMLTNEYSIITCRSCLVSLYLYQMMLRNV